MWTRARQVFNDALASNAFALLLVSQSIAKRVTFIVCHGHDKPIGFFVWRPRVCAFEIVSLHAAPLEIFEVFELNAIGINPFPAKQIYNLAFRVFFGNFIGAAAASAPCLPAIWRESGGKYFEEANIALICAFLALGIVSFHAAPLLV